MKTTLMLFFCALSLTALRAQVIYSEDFSAGQMPAGVALYNLDGLVPDDPDLANMTDSAWTIKAITAQGFPGGSCAFSVSWYVGDAGPSDDWMVLPAVELGSNPYLSWLGMAITSSGNFRDQYQVFVSTTGNTIEDFVLLMPVFDTGAEGEVDAPTSHEISLADYAGETVYIAFRNWTQPYNPDLPTGPGNGGNELAIDNIVVSEGPLAVADRSLFTLQLWPNPVSGDIVYFSPVTPGAVTAVTVLDLAGKRVLTPKVNAVSGRYEVNLSGLASGTYIMQVADRDGMHAARIQVSR